MWYDQNEIWTSKLLQHAYAFISCHRRGTHNSQFVKTFEVWYKKCNKWPKCRVHAWLKIMLPYLNVNYWIGHPILRLCDCNFVSVFELHFGVVVCCFCGPLIEIQRSCAFLSTPNHHFRGIYRIYLEIGIETPKDHHVLKLQHCGSLALKG